MVKDQATLIGKDVIESLTTSMYDDSRFIFREYIQNAADQIDLAVEEKILDEKSKGEIEINIDTANKRISIGRQWAATRGSGCQPIKAPL